MCVFLAALTIGLEEIQCVAAKRHMALYEKFGLDTAWTVASTAVHYERVRTIVWLIPHLRLCAQV